MTLLGLPVEVYANGTQQWASIISVIGVGFALKYVYLPVFYDLQCATCFSYLELRFDKRVKNLVSLLYTISMLLFIPTVIYIPAIAFNQGMFLSHWAEQKLFERIGVKHESHALRFDLCFNSGVWKKYACTLFK